MINFEPPAFPQHLTIAYEYRFQASLLLISPAKNRSNSPSIASIRVREDDLLGPVFADAIGENWVEHLANMSDFWSTVVLASRRYKGNPMQMHIELPRLNQNHFRRWLSLWRIATSELLGETHAEIFVSKAEFMAERLLSAIDLYHHSRSAPAEANN